MPGPMATGRRIPVSEDGWKLAVPWAYTADVTTLAASTATQVDLADVTRHGVGHGDESTGMPPENAALYSALTARDPRFDGVFFVGVTSTGIYCRPICPARTPKPEHCRFFPTAAAAEQASFRPCLRCRPELAPGNAPIDGAPRIAVRIMDRLVEETPEGTPSLTHLAEEFGLSERQLRRIVQRELGASPSGLVRTHRLLLAKQLLTETDLPVIEVAYASGFRSLRRFNDAFRTYYAMPPTRLRRRAREAPGDGGAPMSASETFTLRLAYRPPYDWDGTLAFLGARAMAGVEAVAQGAYLRTVRLNGHPGWIRVRHAAETDALEVDVARGLTTVLPALLRRLRRLFDLTARPDVIAAHLGSDPVLAEAVRANPGLRLPGAFDPFELAVRAVLGQQVSVKAATTLAGRFVRAFGELLPSPESGAVRRPPPLTHLFPTSATIAGRDPDEIAALGIVGARARTIVTLADAIETGSVVLRPGSDAQRTTRALMALPGIGPWTAQYIAMRALHLPDAFPKEDLAVRRALGGLRATEAERRAEAWRPWRSYATLHLWRMTVDRTGAAGIQFLVARHLGIDLSKNDARLATLLAWVDARFAEGRATGIDWEEFAPVAERVLLGTAPRPSTEMVQSMRSTKSRSS